MNPHLAGMNLHCLN